jgi:hypothetical protein
MKHKGTIFTALVFLYSVLLGVYLGKMHAPDWHCFLLGLPLGVLWLVGLVNER